MTRLFSDRLFSALVYANTSHSHVKTNIGVGQVRKYTGDAYIVHPIEVMNILSGVTQDEDVLIAALLHDVVEDTQDDGAGRNAAFIQNEIHALFGERVQKLVLEVTDISRPSDGNRAVRMEIDRQHYALASPDGKSIKLADVISNTSKIMELDRRFAQKYIQEKALLLEFLTEGAPGLYEMATKVIVSVYEDFGMSIPSHLRNTDRPAPK
ncbi:HD domain-containing protein [Methylobacillus sp. Pita2]|uniref:HD domain-containing protein n=1 Tax=Methylobacillus sp. Pita2 TaxID=3383245 RepID=UPI0038B4BD86